MTLLAEGDHHREDGGGADPDPEDIVPSLQPEKTLQDTASTQEAGGMTESQAAARKLTVNQEDRVITMDVCEVAFRNGTEVVKPRRKPRESRSMGGEELTTV